jgi:hypothetical protein
LRFRPLHPSGDMSCGVRAPAPCGPCRRSIAGIRRTRMHFGFRRGTLGYAPRSPVRGGTGCVPPVDAAAALPSAMLRTGMFGRVRTAAHALPAWAHGPNHCDTADRSPEAAGRWPIACGNRRRLPHAHRIHAQGEDHFAQGTDCPSEPGVSLPPELPSSNNHGAASPSNRDMPGSKAGGGQNVR